MWDEVSVDFLGPINDTNYVLVVIDDYSRFPITETLTSLSAKAIIPRLERIFALFGVPSICRSDSGPPFQGDEFRQFAKRMGFKHRRITPLNPRANSIVERFMSPLQKAIKTAVIEGRDYKQEINKFLMNFRACPHPSTGLAPGTIMFNRPVKTLLPQFSVKRKDKQIRKRDVDAKLKRKLYSDKRTGAKQSNAKPGDTVLVKQPKKNKLTPPFNPNPGTVVKTKGSMVTAQHGGKMITRDASHFKRIPSTLAGQNRREHAETLDKSTLQTRGLPCREKRRPARFKDYVYM